MKLTRRRRWMLISALAFSAGLDTASGQTIFRDDFSDGSATDGSPVTWTPEPLSPGSYDASSGDYVLSNGAIMVSTVPAHVLEDTSVRVRAVFLGGDNPNNFVGVAARRGSVYGYAAVLSRTGSIDIVRVDPDFQATSLVQAFLPFNPIDNEVFLQLDAIGNELRFWAWPVGEAMPSEPQLTVVDAVYGAGAPGVAAIAAPSGQAVFRSVHVAGTHIPEPSTLALAGLILVGIAAACYQRTRRNAWTHGVK